MTVHRMITIAVEAAVAVAAVAVVACAGACGGRTDVDNPPAPLKPQGTPVVHFLVDERPHDDENDVVDVADSAATARYGDPFVVRVDDLAGQAHVTIEARLYGMLSRASFVADDDGVVDLSRDAPSSDDGSWTGVDAEALLWSMVAEDGVTPPAQLDLSIAVKVIDDDSDTIVEGALARRFINDGLSEEDVASGRTVGLLAVPPGDGPFPAVLVFGGSEGGADSGIFLAQYLGSLGYAALGVGYFGVPGSDAVPSTLSEIPLEILEEDLAFLAADPRVDADRIAVMGGSRGGELALLLGAHFPIVKAVIANVPSGIVWGANAPPFTQAAWTLDGVDVPFVPAVQSAPDVTTDELGAHVSYRPTFLADIDAASPEVLAAATTHVEDTGGAVLLLAGDADALWPSCVLADVSFQRLLATPADATDPAATPHAERFNDETHCFPNAGHLIGIPGWSTNFAQEIYAPDLNAFMVTGGTPEGMGHADRDSDTAIRAFLENNL